MALGRHQTATTQEAQTTPLRRQYLDIKSKYRDAILFFRLGDFYEMFGQDAERAAAVLQIVLTSREFGKGHRVPMCGVPHHAAPTYIGRLIEAGLHVAICDQVGEPGNGLVARQVTRVITPGTVIDENLLKPDSNNYIAFVVEDDKDFGLAYADISTGMLASCEADAAALRRELSRIDAREVLTIGAELGQIANATPKDDQPWFTDPIAGSETVKRLFSVQSLEGLGLDGRPLATRAVGCLLRYLEDTDASSLHVLTGVHVYSTTEFMELDGFTRTNLELEVAGRDQRADGSLLDVLDQTHTPMGARRLREQLGRPLIDIQRIKERHDRLAALADNLKLRESLQANLDHVGDLERLANQVLRTSVSVIGVRHLAAALEAITEINDLLFPAAQPLSDLGKRLDPCTGARELISRAVTDQGERLIKAGYSQELDKVASEATEAREWIANLERREREATGIKTLKVGYNRVFGYYLEAGRTHADLVPERFQRRQTLANTERYITPDLKEYEALVLGADERIGDLEHALFKEVLASLHNDGERMLRTARALAALDVAASLAEVSARHGYVRPEIHAGDELQIEAGRHPVVEMSHSEAFVPNDVHLDLEQRQIAILTGPNMAGKSTYLRQVALITLLAQIGSFVPATNASIGLVDRIFTRVGARDDLTAGASTFMVEMLELSAILAQATPRSLLVLDEIGRGTSTYDGISVARALIEHLHNHPRLRAKTIFATHYHELTAVAATLPRVHNLNMAATEQDGHVVFLRRVVPGSADRSFGVHVAEMAGLPPTIIRRATAILRELEAESPTKSLTSQLDFLPPTDHPVLELLGSLDLDELTPLEALNTLYELRRTLDQ